MSPILRQVPIPGHVAFLVGSVERITQALITGIIKPVDWRALHAVQCEKESIG
jgi:hypothetical protein